MNADKFTHIRLPVKPRDDLWSHRSLGSPPRLVRRNQGVGVILRNPNRGSGEDAADGYLLVLAVLRHRAGLAVRKAAEQRQDVRGPLGRDLAPLIPQALLEW